MTTAKKSPKSGSKAGSARGGGKPAANKAAPTGKRTKPVPTAPTKEKKKFPVLPVVFGVVALALVAAIVFSPDTEIGAEFGPVTVAGESLDPYSSAADTAVGRPAPEVTGVDFSGDTVSIDNDGTPKAIVFLAHWCPHCQREVPNVQQWLDGGGGVEGVEIVSVATDMNSAQANYPPSSWLEREGWTPPVLRDNVDNDAFMAFGGGGFPYWVFVDGDGNVVRRSSGSLEVNVLESYMQELTQTAP